MTNNEICPVVRHTYEGNRFWGDAVVDCRRSVA
jgi:hypothetical protein